MWKGKLGFVFDVFRRNAIGQLATRASSLPNTFGAYFPQENLNSSGSRDLTSVFHIVIQ